MIEAAANHDDLEGIPPPSANMWLSGRGAEWAEFTDAFESDRMHHAWLLQGPSGIGKATTAFALARYVAGVNPKGLADSLQFDETSATVRQIAQAAHPRVLHLSRPSAERGEGFRTQITVDEIRRLNHFFQSTSGGSWRVAIIDPADDMNRSAANALLKTLEEPPPRSLFLICNHTAGRILPTIRSRCRVLRFEPLATETVASLVQRLDADHDDAASLAAAVSSGGSVRAALGALRNGGQEIAVVAKQLVSAPEPDWTAIQSMADSLVQKGREAAYALALDAFASYLAEEARATLAARASHAAAVASLWQSETARWREAAAYNLDRKQVILTFFQNLHEMRQRSRSA